ncbi:hypothetical protein ABH926_001832 [Catenulispora sp. GP43]|uniref:hypothetical protein n=1 Tax=Catenulispora sp. GP43 TaxID=3156263 RepID=UPI003510D3EF
MTAAAVTAAASVLVGILVGLGSPILSGRLTRRQDARKAQHDLADRILDLWQSDRDLAGLLQSDINGSRRKLLLLSARLTDSSARESCLRLVHMSALPGTTDEALMDQWSLAVDSVARVYRRN